MTTVPKPADPTTSFTATYDAWNRLTKLVDTTSSDTVAEYEYDGAKRRTIQKSYDNGTLDETRHLYYTEPSKWQVIEERVDSDTNPNRQFVWGLRYIDDLIFRDRDTTGNGTLDERLYALQDANWNVTAVTDTAGAVQQRIAYQAYGTPCFYTSGFMVAANTIDWETTYGGCRWNIDTQWLYARNRVLHTSLGVWLQRDPMGYSDGVNLYHYVGGNPASLTDPLGLESCCWNACSDFIENVLLYVGTSGATGVVCLTITAATGPAGLAACIFGIIATYGAAIFVIKSGKECLGPIIVFPEPEIPDPEPLPGPRPWEPEICYDTQGFPYLCGGGLPPVSN